MTLIVFVVHRHNKLVEDEENVRMYRQNPQGNSVIRFTLALLLIDALSDDDSEASDDQVVKDILNDVDLDKVRSKSV